MRAHARWNRQAIVKLGFCSLILTMKMVADHACPRPHSSGKTALLLLKAAAGGRSPQLHHGASSVAAPDCSCMTDGCSMHAACTQLAIGRRFIRAQQMSQPRYLGNARRIALGHLDIVVQADQTPVCHVQAANGGADFHCAEDAGSELQVNEGWLAWPDLVPCHGVAGGGRCLLRGFIAA